MAEPAQILIADDQADVLEALRLLLKTEGFQVSTAGSPGEVLRALERSSFELLLMDLNYARDTTSGREGLDLLSELNRVAPELPVVVMTAWGTVESAVEAMKRGARDYLEKPWDNARLLATLKTQLVLSRALLRVERLDQERHRQQQQALGVMIADSPPMREVLRIVERVAASDVPVLITGEHGTGKELIARRLHQSSHRAGRAFVAINSGGLAEGVFESELFGHVRGAFTDAKSDRAGCFEAADGGTLFLDELGNMPLGQQAKLLRVLQTGEIQRVGSTRTLKVDARVLVATNADLAKETGAGRFREDLLYRLNTIEIRLPPLRERKDDVPKLAAHFLDALSLRYRRPRPALDPAAMQALLTHPWPGNVRELGHVLERALLLQSGPIIQVEDLGLRRERAALPGLEAMSLEEAERYLIERALERAGGNVSEAAKALGLSRSALYRRLPGRGSGALE